MHRPPSHFICVVNIYGFPDALKKVFFIVIGALKEGEGFFLPFPLLQCPARVQGCQSLLGFGATPQSFARAENSVSLAIYLSLISAVFNGLLPAIQCGQQQYSVKNS
jgi:hypothetical protein